MFGSVLNKLRKSIRRRGALGTVRHAAARLARPLLDLAPAQRRMRRLKAERDRAFDERFGVDTGGVIPLDQLEIKGTTWEQGVPYWGIDPDDFARLLAALPVRPEEFTFVDYGSGKGRAVLLAAGHSFRKIVGVEFAPELDRVARENLRTYRGEVKCRDIDLVCGDALEFDLPQGPVVCYFYNPFEGEIMSRVVARIADSYRAAPRDVYVLYANPRHRDVWDRSGCFVPVSVSGDFAVYRAVRAAGEG
jgi:hypothetical protein